MANPPFAARSPSGVCAAAVKSRVPRRSVTFHPRALNAKRQAIYFEAVLVKAARLLAYLADRWTKATPEERREIAQNLFGDVQARDDRIVRATLAHDDYVPLMASATARSYAFGPTIPRRVSRSQAHAELPRSLDGRR